MSPHHPPEWRLKHGFDSIARPNWTTVIDKQIKSPGSPLNFEVRGGMLLPENYAGDLKVQPELDDEPNF